MIGAAAPALERDRRPLLVAAAALALAAAGAGLWWRSARRKPPPSIFDSPVDSVLGYFTRPDFNALPVDERVRYVQQFIGRFRGMSQQDSVVAAAFLAGVTGKVREQLQQNVRILAKDILIQGAATYVNLPESERGRFIDRWVADWFRFAETTATGKETTRPDEEIVGNAREEAKRGEDRQRRRVAGRTMDDRAAGRFLGFWESEVEPASSPREQAQISRFMDAVRTRMLTGQ
ncbi:MAG: hypothetical protein ACKORL_08855 [Phycisphaerales bacterium]